MNKKRQAQKKAFLNALAFLRLSHNFVSRQCSNHIRTESKLEGPRCICSALNGENCRKNKCPERKAAYATAKKYQKVFKTGKILLKQVTGTHLIEVKI